MTLAWWLVLILASLVIYLFVLLSFERRRALEPKLGQDHYYAGLRALLRGDQEIAFQRFKQSVSEDSQNIDAYLRIGDLLRERDQASKALSIHQDLAERGGLSQEERVAVERALAQDHLALGSVEEAIRLFVKLSEERDSAVWAMRRLHRIFLEQGDFEAAYKMHEKLTKRGEPRLPKIESLYLTHAGLKASAQGEHRRGRVFLRDALKLDASSLAGHYYLGLLYERDDRPEDAVRAWKRLLEHAPEQAGLVFPKLEKVLFETGQYSEIVGIYQQVLAADPVNTDARLGLALFAEKKGDDQTAIEHLSRALEIDPGHLLARQKLVQIHRQAGRTEEAWRAADGLFTWLPSAPQVYRCKSCGHTATEPLWHCPGCSRFDTFDLGVRKQAAALSETAEV